jgi:hypothetical protein
VSEARVSERIYVDFNTMMQDLWSEEPRVRLPDTYLERPLGSGVEVILYDEEMEVHAILEPDPNGRDWWARPDWSTRRDLPYHQPDTPRPP